MAIIMIYYSCIKPNRVYKGVIRLIQNYIKELRQEVEYLKNASIELKALNEELELDDWYGESEYERSDK